MEYQIVHECRGRLRVRVLQSRMTLKQADLLEEWCGMQRGILRAIVHERTRGLILLYDRGKVHRDDVLRMLSGFSYEVAELRLGQMPRSSREINRYYEEKLVMGVVYKILRGVFFPRPLSMIYTIYKSFPFLWKALKCVWRRELKVELLDGLSIGISLLRGDFSTAGSVMFLLRLGNMLEEWTHKKSVNDLARSMSLNVERVWRVRDGVEELVSINDIQVMDLIVLHTSSLVPVDGEIVEGEVMVNQASLTGESMSVAKRVGTKVYAGTVIEEGSCVIRVIEVIGSSRYDKIVAMIEASESLKSSVERDASVLADKLVLYTLSGSLLTLLLTGNFARALAVLMVDFSCALKLAMPLSVLSAMREASYYRMTVKGGKYLEAIAKADTIIFDKTGTLTHACPVVVDVVSFNGRDSQEMLRIAACLEEHFPHSMANAVVREAQRRDLQHEEMHSETEYIVAHGIACKVNEERVVIGSAHFVFEDEGCVIPVLEQDRFDSLPAEYTHLYMAISGVLVAVICISDPLRSEAKEVLEALEDLGIKNMVMLTGDSERTASAIARSLGIDRYCSEVLPEDKANYVAMERSKGHTVIMIGDGINDAPALSAADVGLAMSEGAVIAREIADITISSESLRVLVHLRKLSMRLMSRIDSNYRFIIGFNAGLIGLGSIGILAATTTSMLHNLSTIGVSLYSMSDLLDDDV